MATVETGGRPGGRGGDVFDLNALLHPAQAFETPDDVVNDPDLTRNEKRSILASWASDACAVEANPILRADAVGRTAPFDEIVDALRKLDDPVGAPPRRLKKLNVFSRRAVAGFTTARRPSPPEPPRAA